MFEALRDPVWQFVGAVLTVLSLVAMFWIYWLQRQTKELAFGLLSSRRPLAIADELSSRVTVLLDGRSVGNLHLLVFGLKNSGHRAVAPTDFERNLSIKFSDGAVISAEISAETPPNLYAQLCVSDDKVDLQPLLLNPGDFLLIQVLVSSAKPDYVMNARVLDVSTFAPVNTTPRLPPLLQSGLPLMMGVLLAFGVANFFATGNRLESYYWFGFAVITLAMGLVMRFRDGSGKSSRRRINETHPF